MPVRSPEPPKYLRIAGELRTRIRSGEYAPGDQVPSLSDLTAAYHVTVQTVTKAFGVLEDEGLIWKQQGIGTFVSDPLPEEARSEAEQMRADIEALTEKVKELEDRLAAHEEHGHL